MGIEIGRVDIREFRKFIDYCPRCGGELQAYVQLPGFPPSKCYCPSCDIVRSHYEFSPYLCKNCNSTEHYNEDRNEESRITEMIYKIDKRLWAVNVVKRGASGVPIFEYNRSLSKEEKDRLEGEVAELEKKKPRNVCWFCGCNEFIAPSIEKFTKMKDEGLLKAGYGISKRFGEVVRGCESKHERCEPSEVLTKSAKTVYSVACKKCGSKEYVTVPEWQQEEIRELKIQRGEGDSVDTIRIGYLAMSQKIKVTTFSGAKDLADKIKKELDEFEDEKRKS